MIYNIEDLRKAWAAGEHFKYLFFWGTLPPLTAALMRPA